MYVYSTYENMEKTERLINLPTVKQGLCSRASKRFVWFPILAMNLKAKLKIETKQSCGLRDSLICFHFFVMCVRMT